MFLWIDFLLIIRTYFYRLGLLLYIITKPYTRIRTVFPYTEILFISNL